MNIFQPDQGEIQILGTNSLKLGPKEFSKIGYVSENQELPEWMTGKEFLRFCRTMYPAWDDGFCVSLIKLFDLPVQEKIKHMSRGMKMKLLLTSSLAYHPKLLVLDEPFSGLDPFVRQEFIAGILRLTDDEEWTIFVSSHDIEEVERLADGVGIMDEGELLVNESLEDLENRFQQVEVALDEHATIPAQLPKEWLSFQTKGRAVTFVDSQYRENSSPQIIQAIFPGGTINITPLNLREIFLIFAHNWRETKESAC